MSLILQLHVKRYVCIYVNTVQFEQYMFVQFISLNRKCRRLQYEDCSSNDLYFITKMISDVFFGELVENVDDVLKIVK